MYFLDLKKTQENTVQLRNSGVFIFVNFQQFFLNIIELRTKRSISKKK